MGYLDLIAQGYVPEKIWAPQSWKRKQEEGAARRERIAARREPERQIKAAKAAVSDQNREVLFPNATIQAKPSTLNVKEAARKTLIAENPLVQSFSDKTLGKLGTLDTRSGLQKKFDLLSQIKKWESAPKNFTLDNGTDLGRISIGGLNSIIKNPYANSYFGSSGGGTIGTYHASDEEEKNTFHNINQYMKDREGQQRRQTHDYAVQRKQKEIAAIKSSLGSPELLNQTVSIPITNKKSIAVKYGDAVVIDNFIDNTDTDGTFWEGLTTLIDALGLSEEEKKQAESYAGLRLLAKANTSNGKWSTWKELFAPAAKLVQGIQDSTADAKEFFFDMGLGLDKEYAKKKAEEIKFYEENPDQLGLDLYNSNLNGYESNYLAQTKIDNLLGWIKDTTPLTQAISEYGMRSAGNLLGAYGTAYLAGIPQATAATAAALRVTPAVAAVTNSKIGTAAAKALSKTPAIPKVASKGIASSMINKGIGAINKLSAKNVVSFLNPLDNPTTAIMGANAYQNKYVDLLRAGYDENTAQKNALFTGYVNTITEKMGYDGKPGNFFKKSGDVVPGSVKHPLLKNIGNVLLKTYLPNTISEGIEEVYATVLERFGDYVSQVGYLGEDGEYHERPIAGGEGVLDPKAMGESFAGGLIGGAVMGSVGVISDIANMSIETAKANHQDIQKATDSIRKHMEETMKKNGIDNISIPEAPDFQTASVSDISRYYESMVDCYKKILGDSRVIEHDNTLLNKIGKFYSDSETVDALIESGLESPENTPSRKLAEQLKEKREKNQKITVREIGELQRENAMQIAGEEQLTRQAGMDIPVDNQTKQQYNENGNSFEDSAAREQRLEDLRAQYDTPELNELKQQMRSIPETNQIQTPERIAYRENKAKEYYNTFQAKNKNRQAYIIIGPPAAGKSTIAEPLAQQTGSMILDSDIIKAGDAAAGFEGIPEYQGGIGANAVHKESSDIAEMALDYAVERGDNIVYPKVGGNINSILDVAQGLKDNDYTVNLILNDLPIEKALERNYARFQSTGRFIDPEYLIGIDDKPARVYEELKQMGVFDNYERYSNDVAYGEDPIRVETTAGRDGILRLRGSGGRNAYEVGGTSTGETGSTANQQNTEIAGPNGPVSFMPPENMGGEMSGSGSVNPSDAGDAQAKTLERQATAEQTTRAREAQDTKRKVEEVGKAIGRKIEWYNDRSDPVHANQNGYYKDGVIYINENAQNPYMTVLGHESFHSLNAKDRAAIISFVKRNTNTDSAAFQRYRDERRRAYMAEYQKQGRLFSDWDFWEEYTADNMENFFQDEAFVSKLGRQNKTLAEKLWNTLRNLWEKIKQVISPKQYSIGMNEAGQVSGMTDAQFRQIEQMFQKTLGNETDTGTGEKSSIVKRNGVEVVKLDRDIFKDVNGKDIPQKLRDYLKNELAGKEVTVWNPNPNTGEFDWESADTVRLAKNKEKVNGNNILGKMAYPGHNYHGNYRRRVNIASHADEALQVSRLNEYKPDKNSKHGVFAKNGWEYRKALVEDKTGNIYEVVLNIANGNENILYDISAIKKVTEKKKAVSRVGVTENQSASQDTQLSNTTISQNQDSVNSSISENGQNDTEKSSLKRSQFYDSTQNTDNLTQETKEAIAKEVEAFDYEGISNKETMEKAVQEFQKDPLKTASQFFSMQPKQSRAVDIAKGFVLLQNYQQLQDYDSAVAVAKKLREIGTQKGQEVQAFSILNRLTPEGMLYYAQSELDSALEIIAQTKGQDWVNKNRDKFTLTDEEANFIVDTMKRVPSITDERQRKVMIAEVQKLIQEKIPKNLPQNIADKLRSVQRISMLLNPKTIVTRNFGSNVIMAIPHLASEAIGSGIDRAVSKATGVRTTAAPNLKNLGKGFGKGFYDSFDDFRRGINTRDIQDDRFHLGSGPAFRGKYNPLRFLDNVTSYLLDTGDRPFFEAYFLDSLNGQMKVNKVDKPTADMIDIATQSALEKTWQDTNRYTKSAEWIKRGLNLGMKFGLGDIVLPFTKTPANLAKALIDFSPVGFTRGLVADGARLVQAKKRGTLTPQIQRRFVNNVSKGIVGMILYAAAMAVASKGVLSGSDKEDDKDARAFKRDVLGINPYAIKFGNLSGTYDWAQPIGGIMAISADIANQNMSEDSAVNILTNALAAGGNTLFDQSVLTGVSEFFKAADGNIVEALQSAVADIPSQFVPTLLKQIADLTDPVKRSTYDPNKVQQALNTGIAKIPRLEKRLQPSVDVLGRDVKRFGGKNNWFNVFLNPANVNIANPTPELKEVWEVFEETQDTGVFPKLVGNSITNKGITYPLSAQEKTDYQRTLGQETDKGLQELMKSDGYQNASGVQKAEYIKTIISNSDYKAKRELLKQKGVTDSIEDFKNSVAVKKKYYSIWDEVEPEDEDKQARRKAINEVSSVVNALSKKSKLTPGVISGLNQYMDKIESRAANAVDKELNRLGVLREENTDTTGDMDVTSSTMGMFEYTDDGQKYAVNVNYADIPKIMQEVEEETYKQMQRLLNNQYRSQKKKTYGQRYNYKNANADQKIKWVNEVRTDVRNYYKDKYARKYGVRKVPNKLKGVR